MQNLHVPRASQIKDIQPACLHTRPLVNYFVQGPLVMNNVLVSKVNICEVPGTLRRISIL